MKLRPSIGAALLAAGLTAASAGARPVDTIVDEAAAAGAAAAASQARIDDLADEADRLAAQYRTALERTRALGGHAERLERLVAAQRAELAQLDADFENATVVGRELLPLMDRMVEGFAAFVELDLPFLPDERMRRVAELRELTTRADVSIADKYRRLLEAFQAELEYGRTIEAYRGALRDVGAAERTVEFLRVGRLALFYRTLDGTEAGRWNERTKAWETLAGFDAAIDDGLAIARKRAAPDLLELPIPAAPATEAAE